MEKYKICPYCGKHNPPKMLECVQCETDLSNIRVVDDEIMQKTMSEKAEAPETPESSEPKMIRTCDCGAHNPVNARKCAVCGEDISDIVPEPVMEEAQDNLHYVLAALDGTYAYEIVETPAVIGREGLMNEYLSGKSYVSRRHAEISREDTHLFVRNLSQTNYTYVNNKKIPEGNHELHDGDEIGLGGNVQNGSRQTEAAYFQVRIGSCI